ncbi:unnamed protein product [Amoebophrya sp. A25]|nr:unnamed protein product [Amoebophrya sp. A25]|eukprot:GSA25T00017698001.1
MVRKVTVITCASVTLFSQGGGMQHRHSIVGSDGEIGADDAVEGTPRSFTETSVSPDKDIVAPDQDATFAQFSLFSVTDVEPRIEQWQNKRESFTAIKDRLLLQRKTVLEFFDDKFLNLCEQARSLIRKNKAFWRSFDVRTRQT